MKFQFGTKAVLLATAFIAITCGGWIGVLKMIVGGSGGFYGDSALQLIPGVLVGMGIYCGFWWPLVFLGYVVGRWAFNTRIVIVFAVSEAAAVGLSYWVMNSWPS